MNADLLSQYPQVLAFGEAIEPMLRAYRHGLLSFTAIMHKGDTVILRTRLRLSVESPKSLRSTANTPTLRAGQLLLDASPKGLDGLVGAALSGDWLPFSQNPLLKLLPESSGRYGAYYENLAPSHARPLEDPERLVLSGVSRFELLSSRQKEFDRELNEIGFGTLDELMRAYGLRGSDQTTFEIAAESVASIDSASQLRGTRAVVAVRLACGLEVEKFRLTLRVTNAAADTNPHWVSGSDIEWTAYGDFLHGSRSFEFPRNSVIDCRAVYAGRIQHEVRLLDPQALPNRPRMILSIVDPGLGRLRSLLTNPREKERDDFEAAIALLFQMLGFAPAHIGAMSGMTQEPDIFALAPDGEVLIVECTTGVPDDDKLMKLVSRAARVRVALQESLGPPPPPALTTLLITPRLHEELLPIREKAEGNGVLVLCRPDIEEMITRTQFEPDAKDMLRRWRALPLLKLLTGRQDDFTSSF